MFDEKITVSDTYKARPIGLLIARSGVHEMCFKHHGNGKSFSSIKADNILHLTPPTLLYQLNSSNLFRRATYNSEFWNRLENKAIPARRRPLEKGWKGRNSFAGN